MSFLGKIKRRKVFQVAAVYLVVAWLIVQVVDVVGEPLLLPDWFSRVAVVIVWLRASTSEHGPRCACSQSSTGNMERCRSGRMSFPVGAYA